MAVRYATGRRAVGHCQRCGFLYPLGALKYDGQQPDLLVCSDCWDPKHPQEYLPDVSDPVTLLHPTGDTEKSVANLLTIDYPPFIPGADPLSIQIGIGLRPSSVALADEEIVIASAADAMSLLGLPGL